MKPRNIYWALSALMIIVVILVIDMDKPARDVLGTEDISKNDKAETSENEHTENVSEGLKVDARLGNFSEIELQKLADNTTDIIDVLDIQIRESEFVVLFSFCNQHGIVSYKLVSFSLNGDTKNEVSLDIPIENGTEVRLEQFTIGQDGNVYAFQISYEQMSGEVGTPRYNSDVRVLVWNQEGELDRSLILEPLDARKYDSIYINQMAVTKESCISVYCRYGSSSLIVNMDKNGKIQNIVENELQKYTSATGLFWYNYDGTFSFCRYENRGNKCYYLVYDIKSNKFSQEKEVPKEIFDNRILNGNDSRNLFFLKDDKIYQYSVDAEEMRMAIIDNNNEYQIDDIQRAVVIDDDTYLIYYVSMQEGRTSLSIAFMEADK